MIDLHCLKKGLSNIDFFRHLWGWYVFGENLFWFRINPKKLANIQFKKVFGRNIDWNNPKNLIEKIYWFLFYTDTSQWTMLADKYAVREYVKANDLEYLLNRLYGHYENADYIDFELLPNEFVIKTNNACGTIILVRDKFKLNKRKLRKKLNNWLKLPYGVKNAQLHYLKIPPKIIIEQYLHNEKSESDSLIDYKFTCFYGIPESILVVSERELGKSHSYKLNLYDIEWNSISGNLCMYRNEIEIERPKSFQQMILACNKLGRNIPYVRIDFYEVEGKPYFGEMTFTTGFGYFTPEYYENLGSKISLNLK